MNNKKWIKNWLINIFVVILIPFSLTYLYLESVYENNTFEEIVTRQIKNNSIYGTAMNQNTFAYKLELIKQVKPKIIALGSSRVMQFRKDSFNTSFITAGGAMNYLNEGLIFLNEMYKFHKPDYIIIGLDFWWLNDNFYNPIKFPYHENTGNIVDLTKMLRLFKWLILDKIDINTFHYILSNEKILNKYSNYDNLGLDAIYTSDGYRSDGSRSYTKTILGIEPSVDENFKQTFQNIENGNNLFEHGGNISKERLKTLNKILNLIQDKNSKVILFVPPVANAVYNKMSNYNYGLLEEMKDFLKKSNIENYNYHKLSKLTTNDCECIDGFHGGDIIYKRILKDMYNNNSSISKFIDMYKVNKDINKFSGKTLTVSNSEVYYTSEVDFLKLNCPK